MKTPKHLGHKMSRLEFSATVIQVLSFFIAISLIRFYTLPGQSRVVLFVAGGFLVVALTSVMRMAVSKRRS
jgi:hypothetical protein